MHRPMKGSRRVFIRHFVVGTAFSSFLGKAWAAPVLTEVQPQPGTGMIKVRLEDFPALHQENGSVRLAFVPFSTGGPSGHFYPVLINRGSNDRFYCLSAQCQHAGCVVPPYDSGAEASICPCHGSAYAIDGSRLEGPTPRGLISYANTFDGAFIRVAIPNLGFSVTATPLESAAGPRLQLRFPTHLNAKYQVVRRSSLADAGEVVPFATTSGGAATTMLLTGDTGTKTVFVDRVFGQGFFSVAVQVTQQ